MCCHILSLFSHLLSHPLTLHVNHVGVGVCFAFYCVDYFDDSRNLRLCKHDIEEAGHRNATRRCDFSAGFHDEFA